MRSKNGSTGKLRFKKLESYLVSFKTYKWAFKNKYLFKEIVIYHKVGSIFLCENKFGQHDFRQSRNLLKEHFCKNQLGLVTHIFAEMRKSYLLLPRIMRHIELASCLRRVFICERTGTLFTIASHARYGP